MSFEKLVTSSVDPNRLSLAVRGFLLSIVPFVMLFTGMTETEINALIDGVVQVVFFATSAWSAVMVVWGLVRKIKVGRWSAVD